jgi:hypothetical protein
VPDNCSPMPITREQAKGFRLGGYFAFFVAFLSAINWISAIRNDYVIEHHWPAASATVYSIREDSREVSPPSSRQHSYWVYWVEFIVVLDFPRGQCPGQIIALTGQHYQCRGEVKTPEVKSRGDALAWFTRHPRESKLIIHYDPQTRRIALGRESVFDIYPWDKIGLTAVIAVVGVLMLAVAKSSDPDDPRAA